MSNPSPKTTQLPEATPPPVSVPPPIDKGPRLQAVRADSPDSGPVGLATINQRTIAILLDWFVYGVLINIIYALVTHLIQAPAAQQIGKAATLMRFSVYLAYWVFPLYAFGQTLGKKLIGIKVMPIKGNRPLGFFQVLGRETIGRMASFLPFGIGYLNASRRDDRRTFHDRMFSTHVVSLKRE